MRKFRAVSVAVSGLVLGLAAERAAAADFTVGFAIAQSGWMTAYDGDSHKGALIAIDDLNAKGGVLGNTIKTVFADTKSDPAQAGIAGETVLKQGAKFMLASCDFDMGGPAGLAAQKAGVLVISICSGSPKWGPVGIGELAFTTGHAAQVDGFLMAEWAFNKKGWKRAYMLRDTSLTYTRAQCAGFEERWKELAGGLAGVDTFKNDDPSIATQITRLKALNPQPDVLFICTYAPGGPTALRQLRAAGINQPIMSGLAMDGAYWLDGVPGLSNFYVPTYGSVFGDDPDPEVRDFVEKFKKKFGQPPATSISVLGYRAMQKFAIAAEKAKSTDSQAVRKELEKFSEQKVLGGVVWYDDKVHVLDRTRALIMQVQGGKMGSSGEYVQSAKRVPYDVLFKE
ncbi:MAG: amino acid ABC transporter substrate-binding protein [Alphaproteobacteria bacterium]|nr:amino acid ABC transporter substrate-binding protein [Alphaproteobacteria bacterium]